VDLNRQQKDLVIDRRLVDLHAHVLPGLDDGPADAAEARSVCAELAAQGVRTVVATPHVNESYPVDPERVAAAAAALGELPIELLLGAEVNPSRLGDVLAGDARAFTLGGSDVLLVEVNPRVTLQLLETSCHLVERAGLRPLLGHPERCLELQRAPERAHQLLSGGALIQVTAGALVGALGRGSERCARALLDVGAVHVVASDVHGPSVRPARLADAVRWLERHHGRDAVELLLCANPGAVLASGPVRPFLPAEPQRQPWGLLSRLRR
jgi:protein-tyrosine phosphatase